MNKNILKGIWAVLAAFIAVFVLSIGTDIILEKNGIFPSFEQQQAEGLQVWWMALLAMIYRSVYGVLGSYISASLAPNRPMFYALLPAAIGFVLSIIGTVVMWGKAPWWFSIGFMALIFPCAWLGGKLAMKRTK